MCLWTLYKAFLTKLHEQSSPKVQKLSSQIPWSDIRECICQKQRKSTNCSLRNVECTFHKAVETCYWKSWEKSRLKSEKNLKKHFLQIIMFSQNAPMANENMVLITPCLFCLKHENVSFDFRKWFKKHKFHRNKKCFSNEMMPVDT